MFTVVWEYDVVEGREADFEACYGQRGPWVALFRGAPGYEATALLRDVDRPGVYVTLDRWRSADDYARFQDAHRDEYERIDRETAALTRAERRLGAFGS